MAKIYISSTFQDLKEYRSVVDKSLRKIEQDVMAMEYYVSENQQPLDKCLKDVRDCDIYLGIFAWRYGFIPAEQQQSITELEYREAVKSGKECLIFLSTTSDKWPVDLSEDGGRDPVLFANISRLREDLAKKHSLGGEFFDNEDQLASNVITALFHNSSLKRKGLLTDGYKYFCNRDDQSRRFSIQYNSQKAAMPVCVIDGEKKQSHHGLVKRFASTKFDIPLDQVKEIFVRKCRDEQDYYYYLTELFECFGLPSDQLNIQLLIERARLTKHHKVVVIFRVDNIHWSPVVIKIINKFYQEFKSESQKDSNFPQFKLFLNVVYQIKKKSSLLSRLFSSAYTNDSSRIRNQFGQIKEKILLPELQPVGRSELERWLRKYVTKNSIIQNKIYDSYFPKKSLYYMEEIEPILGEIINDYNLQSEKLRDLGVSFSA